jgi:glycosyltransferase involved in cell wall biosynthesis
VSVRGINNEQSGSDRMNIIMFGDLGLNGVWYSRHHLAVGLARRHRVVLVDPPTEIRRAALNPLTFLRPPRFVPDRRGPEWHVPAGWLPDVHRWPGLRRKLNQWRAETLLRDVGSEPTPIAYVWHPDLHEAVEPLRDLPLVYHAYDKYDHYTGAQKDDVGSRERWLVRRAALCIAASAKLGDYLRELGARKVHVLRHGVDTELFHPGRTAPSALTQIPGPRIGVVARLNEVLDVATLLEVALQRPKWSLVLVGGEFFTDTGKKSLFDQLCRLPNVHSVGPQPRETIPHWLAGMDVGLACYDLATWGPYNQPIKLYEYLACGLPVVASDILAARELGPLVERCSNPAQWISAIERSLSNRTPDSERRRVEFARDNSWESRVTELEELLRDLVSQERVSSPSLARYS